MTAYYALKTPPAKEFVVQRILKNMGHDALIPAEEKPTRAHRRAKAKKGEPVRYPMFPRYAFATFNREPDWRAILTAPAISGVVRENGLPAAIREEALEPFKEVRQAPLNRHRGIAKGSRVRVLTGPFEGHHGRITQIIGQTACIGATLLGKNITLRIDLDNCCEHA